MTDPINPSYYSPAATEIIHAMPYFLGAAVKYIVRAGKKGDKEQDLRKAARCIEIYRESEQLLEDLKELHEEGSMKEKFFTDFENEWFIQQEAVHATALGKGWWATPRSSGEIIALIHSEVSEALEAMRTEHAMSKKAKGYSCVEEELADVVIRIMDYAEKMGLNIPGAILAKCEFNKGRPYKHGKKF